MLRLILGVIVGYVAFSVALFLFLSVLYLILGTSGSFQSGNYDVTISWLLSNLVIFLVAGVIAAAICGLIAKNPKSSLYMGCAILVVGLIIAFSQIAQDPGTTARDMAEVPLMDYFGKAHAPTWSVFANAIAGFIGALVGGNFFKRES